MLLLQITLTQRVFVNNLKSNTLLLADVFENFRNMCFEIFELDPEKFFRASELAW